MESLASANGAPGPEEDTEDEEDTEEEQANA
jgi:hypothetical protein